MMDEQASNQYVAGPEAPEQQSAPQLLAGRARGLIRQALMTRFSAFLKPGEALDIDAELADDYVWAIIRLTTVNQSFQLDVEASVLAADQGESRLGEPQKYLEIAIEFLKLQLYEYFRQDRYERFHIDWRIYPVQTVNVRFRAALRQPRLEREADELLGTAADEAIIEQPLDQNLPEQDLPE